MPSLPDNLKSKTHSRVSECDGRPSVQVKQSPVNRMVTASAGVQADLSQVVHSSCRSICHSSEAQNSTVHISSPRPKCLEHRCSEHKLVGSHCLCLASHGSPFKGDQKKNQAIQLPDHCNSPRLARDALVLGPSEALNRDPTSTTSVKNYSQTVSQLCVSQQSTTSQPPRLVSRSGQLQEQGFSVDLQRELLPLRGHQEAPSTSQSGSYFRNGAEKFLHSLCKASLRLLYVPVPVTGPLRPLMVIGRPLLTPWAQWGSISPEVQTLTGYSPVVT